MRREKEYLKECLEKAGIKNEVITTWKRLAAEDGQPCGSGAAGRPDHHARRLKTQL
ncbi:hypothetical protein [Enterocloster sp.]|uniref:hypothetical protein n=1 Tax=Enterocloster sp. TaxID=2719315 RepID=UPI0039A3A542